jgi:hypothetical protein
MGMTPTNFFEVFVEGNFDDFKTNEWSVRHGFNAAVAAFQMADHFYSYHKRHNPEKVVKYNHKGEYLEYLYKQYEAFKDVRSIANAYKHLYTEGRNAVVASTGAIETVDIASKDVADMYTDYSKGGSIEFVVYTRRTGKKIRLLKALQDVIKMWKSELNY